MRFQGPRPTTTHRSGVPTMTMRSSHMSSITGSRAVPAAVGGESATDRVTTYFCSDSRRWIQTVLGLTWVLVGGLQVQSFHARHGVHPDAAGDNRRPARLGRR